MSFAGQYGEVEYKGYPFSPFPISKTVVFNSPFEQEPAFMYGIRMLDINYAENTRASVELLKLTRTEFTLSLKTMHDTKMYGLGVTWMACPWYKHNRTSHANTSDISSSVRIQFSCLCLQYDNVITVKPACLSLILFVLSLSLEISKRLWWNWHIFLFFGPSLELSLCLTWLDTLWRGQTFKYTCTSSSAFREKRVWDNFTSTFCEVHQYQDLWNEI